MRCGQVYTVLDALVTGQQIIAEQAHINYLIEQGLLKRLSPEQVEGLKKEVKELSELESQLRYHNSMKKQAEAQKSARKEEYEKITGIQKLLKRAKRTALEKEIFTLEVAERTHKASADRISPCVKILREMDDEISGRVETPYGILVLTTAAKDQYDILRIQEPNMDYAKFKREVTPQIMPSRL